MAALCGAVLDRGEVGEPSGRAKFQIALSVCPRCKQGSQEGAGVQVAVEASTVARAYCDAQEIGSIDGAEPERAHQDVPPSVVRLVWRRDRGHCRVPGCRSNRFLEVHHVVHREHGGSHEASNLILLCSACHAAHHRGKLEISGSADQLVVKRAFHASHVGVEPSTAPVGAATSRGSRWNTVQTCTQAKEALVRSGWQPKIAAAAVQAAVSALGEDAKLEPLLFEALRRCPRIAS